MRSTFFLFILIFCFSSYSQDFSLRTEHIALVVEDLEKSSNFYLEVLNLKEIKNETGNPKIRWFAFGDSRQLHLLEGDLSKVKTPKSVHLAFAVASLDPVIAHLDRRQYPYENWYGDKNTTNDRPDGVKQIYLQDPNGYWIEINNFYN